MDSNKWWQKIMPFRKGCDSKETNKIIERLKEIKNRNIADIMIPRVEMVSVDYKTPVDGIIEIIKRYNHSRIPVFENRVDNIIGVVYIEDILRLWDVEGEFAAAEIMKFPHFLPESNGIVETIEYFQKERISLAFVVDEYGTVIGLITMEDLIEELVGEIEDEFSDYEVEIEKEDDGYIVSTSIELERLNEELEANFPLDVDYNTLGGLIYSHLERIPKLGDRFIIGDYEFKVVESTSQHVKKVFMRKIKER